MDLKHNINSLRDSISSYSCTIVAVSKRKPIANILEVYDSGHRDFGENKVQELAGKVDELPTDIKWHFIGHLQRNKVKYIAPFVHLIHSVDSLRLLSEIQKQAVKNGRVIECLLQIFIANEETKFGLSEQEAEELLGGPELKALDAVRIVGLMGMASNTDDKDQVRSEFAGLKSFYDHLRSKYDSVANVSLSHLSMGMTSDYQIAIEEGSTLVRIGSAIFGPREY